MSANSMQMPYRHPAEELRIRVMTRGDLPYVESLKAAENWNQTPTDLERFLVYEPQGCFVATWNGVPVGTVTTTTYGQDLGWIGMMLVHNHYRRRGVASALIQKSLDYLQSKNIACIKLDATPAGKPVYEQLGFKAEWEFQRWEYPGDTQQAMQPFQATNFEPPEFDAKSFGANRSEWLRLLAKQSRVIRHESGFGMIRPGSRAWYLGPVTARSPKSAATIIRELLGTIAGPIFWDVPGPNHPAVTLAEELGFQPVRQLLRMWAGQNLYSGIISQQYALADPATG